MNLKGKGGWVWATLVESGGSWVKQKGKGLGRRTGEMLYRICIRGKTKQSTIGRMVALQTAGKKESLLQGFWGSNHSFGRKAGHVSPTRR